MKILFFVFAAIVVWLVIFRLPLICVGDVQNMKFNCATLYSVFFP